MSKILLSLMFPALLLSATSAVAQNTARRSAQAMIPIEVSAVLTSPEYARVIADLSLRARQSGRIIAISGYQVLRFGPETFVTFAVSARFAAAFGTAWTPAGEVVAQIAFGPMGEPGVSGVYFKPPVGGPGGISVGNN